MYLAFPIGWMYYFGTNLDERFKVTRVELAHELLRKLVYGGFGCCIGHSISPIDGISDCMLARGAVVRRPAVQPLSADADGLTADAAGLANPAVDPQPLP